MTPSPLLPPQTRLLGFVVCIVTNLFVSGNSIAQVPPPVQLTMSQHSTQAHTHTHTSHSVKFVSNTVYAGARSAKTAPNTSAASSHTYTPLTAAELSPASLGANSHWMICCSLSEWAAARMMAAASTHNYGSAGCSKQDTQLAATQTDKTITRSFAPQVLHAALLHTYASCPEQQQQQWQQQRKHMHSDESTCT